MKLCFFVLALLATVTSAQRMSAKVPIVNYFNYCIIWVNHIFPTSTNAVRKYSIFFGRKTTKIEQNIQ